MNLVLAPVEKWRKSNFQKFLTFFLSKSDFSSISNRSYMNDFLCDSNRSRCERHLFYMKKSMGQLWSTLGQQVNIYTISSCNFEKRTQPAGRRLILTKFQVWFWKREIILDWYYTSSKEEIIICNKLSRTNFWLNVLQWFLINFKLFFCESVSAAGRPKQRIFSKLSTKFQKNDFFIKQIVSKHYLVCLGLTPTIFRPWINSLLLYSSSNIPCPQNEKE